MKKKENNMSYLLLSLLLFPVMAFFFVVAILRFGAKHAFVSIKNISHYQRLNSFDL